MTSNPTKIIPASRSFGPMMEHSQRSRSLMGRLSARAPAARLPRWSAAFGKPGGVDLLVHVAQALRTIADERPLIARAIQYVGAVDVFGIERRILSHQYDVV